MKRKETTSPTWIIDYSAARAHAIRWLGDRYLLAKPINASHYGSRQPTPGIGVATRAELAGASQPAAASEAFSLPALAR